MPSIETMIKKLGKKIDIIIQEDIWYVYTKEENGKFEHTGKTLKEALTYAYDEL